MGHSLQPNPSPEKPPSPRKVPGWAIPPIVALACWLLVNIPGMLPETGKVDQINGMLPLFLAFVAFAACFSLAKLSEPARAYVGIILFLIVYLGATWLLHSEEGGPPPPPPEKVRPSILNYQPSLDFDVLELGPQGGKIYVELKPCDRTRAAYPKKFYVGETTQEGWNTFSLPIADVDWAYVKTRNGSSPPCFEMHVYQLGASGEGVHLGTIKVK
ncbi:MAG: hypothetical protein IPK76_22475 [Lewinellaceae bacterium]|nr:hypothetical protein [Lewinellaceae bacterium]